MKKEKIKNKTEKIEERALEEEMKDSYLDYAMSVIISRALPDVRDGLKPVQRRILYAMWKMGLKSNAKFRKSAAVVGEVLAKFHPHGDLAVYDTLVRIAQDFSLRYPLIQGQGNFGSIDGDTAAAYRYTEVRLSPLAEELLSDLEKDTVDWTSNYDGTTKEPLILPAKLPNLLINGSSGIAVGVATNLPPHNLSEVCDGLIYLIDHPSAETSELMNFILGPDFPSGGLILGGSSLEEAYTFGKGKIILRAKTEIFKKNSHSQIIIKEIPYLVEKKILLEKITQAIEEKKIQEIKSIKDLSDKHGIRVIIDLKKEANPEKTLNRLFNFTPLETSYHFNLLALVDGLQVKNISLKNILEAYLSHRKIVLKRKTEWELNRVLKRIHLLEGFDLALLNLSTVIKIIKESKDKETAKINLQKRLTLSEAQALAILDLKLWQLNRLERQKLKEELKELKIKKKNLSLILSEPKKILNLIKEELKELKEKYGDKRKTEIIKTLPKEFKEEDLIPDEPTIVSLSRDGYIKRISPEQFRLQERGGKGTLIVKEKETDILSNLIFTSTISELLFFTDRGKVFKLKTYEIPERGRTSKGESVINFLSLTHQEKISSLLAKLPKNYFLLSGFRETSSQKFLLIATKKGMIKKIEIKEFEKVKKGGLIVIGLEKDDFLISVKPSTGDDEVLLVSRLGQSIRFSEKEIRKSSRQAKGIRGIKLTPDDEIINLEILPKKSSNLAKIFTITEAGFGKTSLLSSFRIQRRSGIGIRVSRLTEKTGKLVKAIFIDEKNLPEGVKGDLIIASNQGQVLRIPLKSIPLLGRVSQGVRLIKFKEKKDKVSSVVLV